MNVENERVADSCKLITGSVPVTVKRKNVNVLTPQLAALGGQVQAKDAEVTQAQSDMMNRTAETTNLNSRLVTMESGDCTLKAQMAKFQTGFGDLMQQLTQ